MPNGGDAIMKSSIDRSNGKQYPEQDKTGLEGRTMSAEEDKLLTVQEMCSLLKVPKTYIYSLTHSKKIPHMKLGGLLRFRKSAIDEWLRSREVRDVNIQKEK